MSCHVIKKAFNSWTSPFTTVQKRFTHRAPSFTYLKQWEKHDVNYVNMMNVSFHDDQNPGVNMINSPEKVSQILRVEAAMQMRGLTPFIHAMPASSKVLLKVYRTFSSSKNSPNDLSLRSPFDTHFKLAEIRKRIPKEDERLPKPEFLSVSYALTCNTVPLESAASWGFINHFGKDQYFPVIDHLNSALKEWEKRNGKEVPSSFRDRSRTLIRQYNRLKVGDFFVLGVPSEKLDKWMYDAKPYYVPTGRDVRSIVKLPTVTKEEGTIATLLLAKEVLNPSSGLIVVPTDNADRFCQGLDLTDPRKIGLYRQIVNSDSTAFEKAEKESREKIDQQLELFISDFKTWMATGEVPFYDEKEDHGNFDFVELLP